MTAAATDQEAPDSGLLAIYLYVDADDYASAAAEDTPTAVPRTYQSEADFQAIKKAYSAKIHGNDTQDSDRSRACEELAAAVPQLQIKPPSEHKGEASWATDETGLGDATGEVEQVKLSKKDAQLLAYAVGELYFHHHYAGVIELCARVREQCEVDVKTRDAMARWMERCRERMG